MSTSTAPAPSVQHSQAVFTTPSVSLIILLSDVNTQHCWFIKLYFQSVISRSWSLDTESEQAKDERVTRFLD